MVVNMMVVVCGMCRMIAGKQSCWAYFFKRIMLPTGVDPVSLAHKTNVLTSKLWERWGNFGSNR